MSTTYSLCCPEKKLKLWIGQRRSGVSFYVYEDEDTMTKLSNFLIETEGHPLVFTSDYCEEEWFLNCEEYKNE